MCDNHNHHHHSHDHSHDHFNEHSHHHDLEDKERKIIIETEILSENQKYAERNRGYFSAKNICCINLVSSPGSGKTSILEEVIKKLKDSVSIAVIEGDQQTTNDSDRISALGVDSVQINTLESCHLEAFNINEIIKEMNLKENSLLFIENVGNLVCPAMYDLGESLRGVVLSVTEGDDKPLKYPYMFESAQLCIINKIDLLPYVKSDVEKIKQNALLVNHHLQFFEVSAQTGEGLDKLCEFLKERI